MLKERGRLIHDVDSSGVSDPQYLWSDHSYIYKSCSMCAYCKNSCKVSKIEILHGSVLQFVRNYVL